MRVGATLGLVEEVSEPEAAALDEAVVQTPPVEPGSRAALVYEAARRWRAQLIDLGGRNTLLYYRDLKAGTLDLGAASEVALAALLAGRAVTLAQLFPDRDAHAQAVKRARTIRNKARELHEERGIETCYVAVGMATWSNPKAIGVSTPAAPVLLRTAQLRARGAAEDDYELHVDDEVEVNPTLLHLLAEDFGVVVDDKELEELAESSLVYERLVKEAAGRVRGFMITPKTVLGTFSYAKLPMVTDLLHTHDVLIEHDVIAAIAGDRAAQQSLRPALAALGEWPDPDAIEPRAEFLVLDADSSQNYAINAVLAGQHSVVKGPPGTGKSQTIANLISSLAARGKRVLFVAEKRAAITAVTDRLTRRGLGHLVMDVHDGTASRRKIAAELKAAFDSAASIALPDLNVLHESLAVCRDLLGAHQHALHDKRDPWGVSVFDAQTVLIGLTAHIRPMTPVRLRGDVLAALDAATARRVRQDLREFANLGGFTLTERESGWAGANIHSTEDAQRAYELADRLSEQTLPAARPALLYVVEQTGLRPAVEVGDWRSVFAFLDGVRSTLSSYHPSVFVADLEVFVAAVADRAWRKAHRDWPGADAGWLARRRTRKKAAELWSRSGKASRRQLFEGLSAALAQRQQWARAATDRGQPRLPAELDRARAAFDRLDRELAALQAITPRIPLSTMDLDRLARVLDGLAGDERTLRKVPRLNQLTEEFNRFGLDPLVADLEGRRPDADLTGMVFDGCWYASILHHLSYVDPRVGTFEGDAHSRVVRDYRRFDHEHLDATSRRVLRAVAEHIVQVRDQYPDESRAGRAPGRPEAPAPAGPRSSFATRADVLTRAQAVLGDEPARRVSQLLPADGQYFDVVIFDEASQVTPADAVPAILRGRQVVVAGDEQAAPADAFFAAAAPTSDGGRRWAVNADGVDRPVADRRLRVDPGRARPLLRRVPCSRWHYRSRDERLIAFSNAHIYDRSLITFPGTAGAAVLRARAGRRVRRALDDEQRRRRGRPRSSNSILEHAPRAAGRVARRHHHGHQHAERIDGASARRPRRTRPEPARRSSTRRPRRAVLRQEPRARPGRRARRDHPLDRLRQERPTAGCSTASARCSCRRRRTAAQRRRHPRPTPHDLVSLVHRGRHGPERSHAPKASACSGRTSSTSRAAATTSAAAAAERPALNPSRSTSATALVAAGIPVTPQYGVAGYCIDFAAAPSDQPGGCVLAIETRRRHATTPRAPRATATGSARNSSSGSAGASTGSGRPTGSTTPNGRSPGSGSRTTKPCRPSTPSAPRNRRSSYPLRKRCRPLPRRRALPPARRSSPASRSPSTPTISWWPWSAGSSRTRCCAPRKSWSRRPGGSWASSAAAQESTQP